MLALNNDRQLNKYLRKLIDTEPLDNYDASAGFDSENLEEFVPNLTKQETAFLLRVPVSVGSQGITCYNMPVLTERQKEKLDKAVLALAETIKKFDIQSN